MCELASLASFLHRVEPPLDALERLLYAVVAVSRLRAPLVDEERRQPHQKEDVQKLRLPVLEAEGEEARQVGPNATGSPYQDISFLKSNHSTTAYTSQLARNSTPAVMLRL